MKFSHLPYERPDVDDLISRLNALTAELKAADSYEAAKEVFLREQKEAKHLETLLTLVTIRHSVDTRDEFYDAEMDFWNASLPRLQEPQQEWTAAMLAGQFRENFAAEYGDLMFVNAEIELKTFKPLQEFIAALTEENELTTEYEKLLASASIPFEGKTCTLSQLSPFKTDPDDSIRLAAWQAEGRWYKENQQRLDAIYDRLVALRDSLGRMLGYDGFTELGYYRMGRNCYTKQDVEKFRAAVVKHLVPVADSVYRAQAKRLGAEYPLSFADAALDFRSGNPRPFCGPEELLQQGRRFYEELSPETGEFFNLMLESELMDVLSTEGKEAGGYCTELPDYELPFIFANFNGTQGDVEVITHEAGHAFEAWLNRKRIPLEYCFPTMEACEVHSMSMEFFAEPYAEYFFGDDARKFRFSHLASALTFIPYGTMVDHFQHSVYENPGWTPAERHAEWKRLLGIYMPWLRLDGDIPFYSDGEGWQRQHHIYSSPFYYIDYCLAQTVALEFWKLIGEDSASAWKKYMAYSELGGSLTFTQLLERAELPSPFEEACLRGICEKAKSFLDAYDLTGIE